MEQDGDGEKAIQHTIELAILADQLGFDRFWVSEHHGSSQFAGTAPEILMPYLLAKTDKVKVGSGGILLQHYSSFKIAEISRVLEVLGTGRVELGIGRSPGGLPAVTKALQKNFSANGELFEEKLTALLNYINSADDAGEVAAYPKTAKKPHVFLLGSSGESAGTAASKQLDYVFASFFSNDKKAAETAIQRYRSKAGGQKSVLFSPAVIIAETEQKAAKLASQSKIITIHFEDGKQLVVSSEEDAKRLESHMQKSVRLKVSQNQNIIHGTFHQVKQQLNSICRQLPINGFIFHIPVNEHNRRVEMIYQLAELRQSLSFNRGGQIYEEY